MNHTYTHGCAYANAIKHSGKEGKSAREGAALADADELNRKHCINITDGRWGEEGRCAVPERGGGVQ